MQQEGGVETQLKEKVTGLWDTSTNDSRTSSG